MPPLAFPLVLGLLCGLALPFPVLLPEVLEKFDPRLFDRRLFDRLGSLKLATARLIAEIRSKATQVLALYLKDAEFSCRFLQSSCQAVDMLKCFSNNANIISRIIIIPFRICLAFGPKALFVQTSSVRVRILGLILRIVDGHNNKNQNSCLK